MFTRKGTLPGQTYLVCIMWMTVDRGLKVSGYTGGTIHSEAALKTSLLRFIMRISFQTYSNGGRDNAGPCLHGKNITDVSYLNETCQPTVSYLLFNFFCLKKVFSRKTYVLFCVFASKIARTERPFLNLTMVQH